MDRPMPTTVPTPTPAAATDSETLAGLRASLDEVRSLAEATARNEQATERRVRALEAAHPEGEVLTPVVERTSGGITHYDFQKSAELIWAVLTAVVGALAASTAMDKPPSDWHAWLIGIGAAAVRAVLGAVMSWLNKQAPEQSA